MYGWKALVFAMVVFVGFAPALAQTSASGAPPEYKLRVGDSIQLDFRLSPELTQAVTIDPDGTVSLLVIGRVPIAGLTLQEARQLILSKESAHLVRPEINIQVTNFQRQYVIVSGEVFLPQKIEMREDMTALQAILQSGGIKISGRETQVLLYRKVNSEFAEVYKLNLRIKNKAQLDHDMKLMPGDLILVPRNKVESVGRYARIAGLSYALTPQAY
jgi:polysaccharide biosynthesis/export protein